MEPVPVLLKCHLFLLFYPLQVSSKPHTNPPPSPAPTPPYTHSHLKLLRRVLKLVFTSTCISHQEEMIFQTHEESRYSIPPCENTTSFSITHDISKEITKFMFTLTQTLALQELHLTLATTPPHSTPCLAHPLGVRRHSFAFLPRQPTTQCLSQMCLAFKDKLNFNW